MSGSSGKNWRVSACMVCELQIFLLSLDDPCVNFSNLSMNPMTMKFIGGCPSTLNMLGKNIKSVA